ncbi:MAG: pimeloyl-ACP methyl ester carboxylesterase [Hyphomicrobiaceae bacterium]|jgi:pimeloyl-ACP methyl ester carboxylesterase
MTATTTTKRFKTTRFPYMTVFKDQPGFKDTYGGEAGYVFVESMLVRPVDRDSKTVIVFSHPVGGGSFLPVIGALAAAGHHVLYVNTRYRGNDTALIMEKCVLDLGAAISDARERFGYQRVVLGGWSGGGSLALFYQEQAEHPTVSATPAGDPPDLTIADLIPGDGLMIIAAHTSRAVTLTEWMDASILDESDPTRRDPELDLYDAANPNQPPYTPAFLDRYRAAQIARNRRITAWVRQQLDEMAEQGRIGAEHCFVVQGTMADPRWLDPTVDPNDREPGRCYLGNPSDVNNGPVGLARFTTLRSWLSQWSYDESKAHGERNAANISIPALVIGNSADDACTPSHTNRLFEAIGHDRKERFEIAGATHYYAFQREQLAECVAHCTRWLEAHGFDS